MSLTNDLILHKVFLQRIIKTEVSQFTTYIQQARAIAVEAIKAGRITKKQEKQVAKVFTDFSIHAVNRLKTLANYEAEFTYKVLQKHVNKKVNLVAQEVINTAVTKAKMGLSVGKKKMTIPKAYQQFTNHKAKQVVQNVRDYELERTMSEPEGIDKLDYLMKGLMLFQLTSLVATSINAVNESAKVETFEANKEIIQGVEWVTMLDDSVCLDCEALHGEQWALDDAYEEPPLHANCRCELHPILL